MTDLTTLIAKLEAAKGPDRYIDAEIFSWARGEEVIDVDFERRVFIWEHHADGERVRGSRRFSDTPSLTVSIDDAVALAKHVLPGWDWGANSFGEDGAQGKVWKHGWHDDTVIYADHPSPAIALVIAILRAKQAEGKP